MNQAPSDKPRFSSWEATPRATIGQARASARRARRLRLALPLLAVSIAAAFIVTLRDPGLSASPVADQLGLGAEGDVMTSPRFLGEDGEGREYTLEAETARRRGASGMVEFERPVARQPQPDGRVRTARASRGAFGENANRLTLEGDVQLDLGDGHVFVTRRAVVDFDADRVDGPAAVTGAGPLGDLRADSFSVTDGGARLVFSGDVRFTLDAAALDAPAAKAPEPRTERP